jgi:hypothetical protein
MRCLSAACVRPKRRRGLCKHIQVDAFNDASLRRCSPWSTARPEPEEASPELLQQLDIQACPTRGAAERMPMSVASTAPRTPYHMHCCSWMGTQGALSNAASVATHAVQHMDPAQPLNDPPRLSSYWRRVLLICTTGWTLLPAALRLHHSVEVLSDMLLVCCGTHMVQLPCHCVLLLMVTTMGRQRPVV